MIRFSCLQGWLNFFLNLSVMWLRVLLMIIVCGTTSSLLAQNPVQVQVIAREDGEGIPAAYIKLFLGDSSQPSMVAIADAEGKAILTVNSFPAFVEAVSIGYEPARVPVTEATVAITINLTQRFSSLDEVVVTGVTAPVRMQEAMSTYQVITKAAMQAQGAVTVNDALKNQLNMSLSNDGILGSRTSMQGMKGDKVKILIDGIPLNGREFGEIDLGQINLNNVERIEVVQGPMSVIYGTDALGGVINIITRKDNQPWRIEGGSYYESIGKYNFDVSGTYRLAKRHQLSLGGGRNFFDGWKELDTIGRAFSWKPKEQYIANFAYNYTAKSSFRLQFASDFIHEKITNKDIAPSITPFYARARDEYYRNLRSNNRLNLSGTIGKSGQWQLQNAYNIYRRTRNTYMKDLVTLNEELLDNSGMQDTTTFSDVILRGTYSNTFKKLGYTVGYDINHQQGESGKIPGGAKTLQDYALFATSTYGVLDQKLKFQPAIRYSYNTVYTTPLIPSFNVLYNPEERWQFRFSYAKGFRAPSLKELYLHFYDSNHEVEGNPNLKPEQGHHLQASGSWTAYRKEANFLKFMLSTFHNNVYNQISLYQPDTNKALFATYTNIERMKNVIGTFQVEGQWKGLYAQLGYSLFHLLEAGDNVYANSSQASATIQYHWKKPGLNISTFIKHSGKQPRLQTTIDGGSAYNGILMPYTFWDASIEKRFWKNRLQLIAGVKNLLNVQNPNVANAQSGGVHASGSTELAAGRSYFTSLRITLQ